MYPSSCNPLRSRCDCPLSVLGKPLAAALHEGTPWVIPGSQSVYGFRFVRGSDDCAYVSVIDSDDLLSTSTRCLTIQYSKLS